MLRARCAALPTDLRPSDRVRLGLSARAHGLLTVIGSPNEPRGAGGHMDALAPPAASFTKDGRCKPVPASDSWAQRQICTERFVSERPFVLMLRCRRQSGIFRCTQTLNWVFPSIRGSLTVQVVTCSEQCLTQTLPETCVLRFGRGPQPGRDRPEVIGGFLRQQTP